MKKQRMDNYSFIKSTSDFWSLRLRFVLIPISDREIIHLIAFSLILFGKYLQQLPKDTLKKKIKNNTLILDEARI